MLLSENARTDVTTRKRGRADVVMLGAEVVFVGIVAALGAVLNHRGVTIHAGAAPLAARWLPHVGIGTPLAIAVAALVGWRGLDYAHTASWRKLLAVSYVTATGWIFGLALIDGWHRGIARRLATPDEFVANVGRVKDIHPMLATFSQHILAGPADSWTTHVAGHPPGAFLIFVVMDRIGLGGGAAAGVACILIGALAPVGIAATIRALGHDTEARIALPFLVLFPGAIWVGASADGLFMGVAALGIALLALPGWRWALPGGLLLGYTLYLSYGLVLIGLLALAVVVLKPPRRLASLAVAGVGAAAVIVAFSVAGFWWPTGYRLVQQRYYQGWGAERPYSYWIWGDLAGLVACAGPVLLPVLRRVVAGALRGNRSPVVVLPLLAVVAMIAADLSGLSKGEVERIWLPFAIWVLAATPMLPERGRRSWLIGPAVVAVLINSLLLTAW